MGFHMELYLDRHRFLNSNKNFKLKWRKYKLTEGGVIDESAITSHYSPFVINASLKLSTADVTIQAI